MTTSDTARDELSVPEEQAFALSRAAILLDQARQDFSDAGALGAALNENLETWVAIKTIAETGNSGVSETVRQNLVRLSNFVADTTFKSAEDISEQTIDTLININLQISEGLLEGASKA
ncbi:MAG: hypothetical protein ISR47_01575 [Rhodospirillales bacterium]|nr:hypothetical protein [Rhodospirillales bacterium]